MAEPRRVLRLQQLVLETLATALVKDVDDPRLKGVTITRVKLSKDLSRALVFWSNLEPGGPRRTAERGIEDALAYLQAIVADAMTTRVTPHLEFKFDEGLERAGRIQQIFDKLSHERGDAPEDAPASSPTAEDDGGEEPERGRRGGRCRRRRRGRRRGRRRQRSRPRRRATPAASGSPPSRAPGRDLARDLRGRTARTAPAGGPSLRPRARSWFNADSQTWWP